MSFRDFILGDQDNSEKTITGYMGWFADFLAVLVVGGTLTEDQAAGSFEQMRKLCAATKRAQQEKISGEETPEWTEFRAVANRLRGDA